MRGRRVSEQLRHEKVKAHLLHIDKDGPGCCSIQPFTYDVAECCNGGGDRCHELEVEAYRVQNAHNAMPEGANMARLSNANAGTR